MPETSTVVGGRVDRPVTDMATGAVRIIGAQHVKVCAGLQARSASQLPRVMRRRCCAETHD